MKFKTAVALAAMSISVNAQGTTIYDDYHNINSGKSAEDNGVFKVNGKKGKAAIPVVQFILRYQSGNNKCQLSVADYSNIDSSGRPKTSRHYVNAYDVNSTDRSCEAQLGAEFSFCHYNQSKSNGYASIDVKRVWDKETEKYLFQWNAKMYRQKKYEDGMIAVMCNK